MSMEYLAELKHAIRQSHGCEATHAESVPVKEVFRGEVAWDGIVEVFDITGHPKAKRCYAWGHPVERGPREITTVLKMPPVVSVEIAVKIAIATRAPLKNLRGPRRIGK